MIPEEQLFLIPKRLIEDSFRFRIPTGLTRTGVIGDGYCSWEELINTKGPLPSDSVMGISWDEEEFEEDSGVSPALIVIRKRFETDEEYLERLKQEEEQEKWEIENEYNEYKRLKAKYEAE